jgi:hypothetical protein
VDTTAVRCSRKNQEHRPSCRVPDPAAGAAPALSNLVSHVAAKCGYTGECNYTARCSCREGQTSARTDPPQRAEASVVGVGSRSGEATENPRQARFGGNPHPAAGGQQDRLVAGNALPAPQTSHQHVSKSVSSRTREKE